MNKLATMYDKKMVFKLIDQFILQLDFVGKSVLQAIQFTPVSIYSCVILFGFKLWSVSHI